MPSWGGAGWRSGLARGACGVVREELTALNAPLELSTGHAKVRVQRVRVTLKGEKSCLGLVHSGFGGVPLEVLKLEMTDGAASITEGGAEFGAAGGHRFVSFVASVG